MDRPIRYVAYRKGIRQATQDNPTVRALIDQKTASAQAFMASSAAVTPDKTWPATGKRRARGYVWRFDGQREAADGLLLKALHATKD